MKPMIQLHLEIDSKKPEAANLPIQDRGETKPILLEDRMHRMLYHTGHKRGVVHKGSSPNIFSN